MRLIYVLFEHASGYSLFRAKQFEEVAVFVPQVRKSVLKFGKFKMIVELLAFQQFRNMSEALENMKCLAKGELHLDLQIFLENNVPKNKKSKQTNVLGVQDVDLAHKINEKLQITCITSGVIKEIVRGIRVHFPKYVSGYKNDAMLVKSQQGLGHHYARSKLNMTSGKCDLFVTESLATLDKLNEDIRTLTGRLRVWFSLNFPELSNLVPDPELYVKCVKEIKDRRHMPEDIESRLQSLLNDTSTVEQILKCTHMSMGMDMCSEDKENIEQFVEQILSLTQRRDEVEEYLKKKMHQIAPNLSVLISEVIGARLIQRAGNLINLAKMPASTVQVLGADKSLFRSLKVKGAKTKTTPKFSMMKGKTSRLLSHKCTLAAKIDCFSATSTDKHGLDLKQLVDEQTLKF